MSAGSALRRAAARSAQRASLADLPAPPPGRAGWPWTEESPPLPAARPDGRPWPRVSIVTPVYNQAQYLEETLRSVLLQGYPDLEYVVVNDGSTDDSEDVIRRYEPWLAHWVTQPNLGQRAAINRGFEHVTGGLLGYINSDDLLLPGALRRAAEEIDPARGRNVIMGRCRFTDPEGRYVGVEHPSRFQSHARVLQVWKGHTIPQPSVFWTPQVWRDCGPVVEEHWVDYGLFCRFSRRYRFHFVDQVMSTYRLHPESKTQVSGEEQRLHEAIAISRRYWGSPLSPRRWHMVLSLFAYRFDRRGRGLQALRRAREERRQGRLLAGLGGGCAAALLAPEVVFSTAVYPELLRRAPPRLRRTLQRLGENGRDEVQTQIFMEHTDPWSDGWVGPRLCVEAEAPEGARALRLAGAVEMKFFAEPLRLCVSVAGRPVGEHRLAASGPWEALLPLPGPLPPGRHAIQVEASAWFVPHRVLGNADHRPLAWRMDTVSLV